MFSRFKRKSTTKQDGDSILYNEVNQMGSPSSQSNNGCESIEGPLDEFVDTLEGVFDIIADSIADLCGCRCGPMCGYGCGCEEVHHREVLL